MNSHLAKQLEAALRAYREDRPSSGTDDEKRDGMAMIGATVQRLIEALERGDISSAKMEILTFSKQSSDVYFEQPRSFRKLAEWVGKVRKEIV